MENIQEPRLGFINRFTKVFRRQPQQPAITQRTPEDEALLNDADLLRRTRRIPFIQSPTPSSLPDHNPNPPEPIPFPKAAGK